MFISLFTTAVNNYLLTVVEKRLWAAVYISVNQTVLFISVNQTVPFISVNQTVLFISVNQTVPCISVNQTVLFIILFSRPVCPLTPFLSSVSGELINLAMYCERMRRRFWPEWFVDLEDWYYTGDESDSDRSSPACLLDLGLFSRTDTLEDSDASSCSDPHSQAHPHADSHKQSPDSDRSGRSLFDSDIDSDGGSDAEQKKEVLNPDLWTLGEMSGRRTQFSTVFLTWEVFASNPHCSPNRELSRKPFWNKGLEQSLCSVF